MTEYLQKYKELLLELKKEQEKLERLNILATKTNNKYLESISTISNLKDEIQKLTRDYDTLIQSKTKRIKVITILSSLLAGAILYNFGLNTLSIETNTLSLYSLLFIISSFILSECIPLFPLEKRFYIKDEKVKVVKDLIDEKVKELERNETKKENLYNEKINIFYLLSCQRSIVCRIEQDILNIKVAYASSIFDSECQKEDKPLIRRKQKENV